MKPIHILERLNEGLNYSVDDSGVMSVYYNNMLISELEDCNNKSDEELSKLANEVFQQSEFFSNNKAELNESSIDDLKNGAVITIGGKKNYDPASFKYRDGKVYYKSKHMTGNTWAEHPNNLKDISKHFDRMEKEGFTLTKDDDADEEISKEETSKGSTMEQNDIDMLKSIYAYSNETPNYKDNKYYKELVSKYGDKVVDREYKQIADKYTIVPNVGTDSEGVTYNSLRERNIDESAKSKKLKESSLLTEKPVYMNTWANYNENGADLSRYGINDIADGWMTIDDALAFCEKYAEDEPFINDVDGVPIEVSEYDNAVDKLNELKEIEDADVDEDIFTAFVEEGSYTSVPEIIEQIEGGDYLFFPGVDNDAALAEAYIDMCGGIVEAVGEDRLDTYFDEESWKRDAEDDIRNIIVDNEGYDSIDDVTDEELESYMDSILADEMSVAKYDHNDDFFTNYFDYDSYGSDLAYDFTYTSTGALSIY